MAMVQALNDSYFKTFNDLAEIIVKRLVRKLRNSDVDAVTLEFDRYDVQSIKTTPMCQSRISIHLPDYEESPSA